MKNKINRDKQDKYIKLVNINSKNIKYIPIEYIDEYFVDKLIEK